jgi:tetratricopeptide (TPR) repeat protein
MLPVATVGCAPAVGPPKRPAPSTPLDARMPEQAPEPQQLAGLLPFWDQEVARTPLRIQTGPLEVETDGQGNFDQIAGQLAFHYVRNPFLSVEGSDDARALVNRPPARGARRAMESANKHFGAGRLDEALAGYRKVIEMDPLFAKPYFYVAAVLKQRRDLEAANAWNDRGLRLAPRDAFGYATRAEILVARGQGGLARAALANALALDPFSPPALKLLATLGATRRPGITPPVLVRRQPSDGGGEILVARGGGHPAWQRYAVCRALLTYDPRVRVEFLQGIPAGIPSLQEEARCGYLVAAAYRLARVPGGPAPDADLERWARAYDANLLREAVIYETIGCRRPEILLLLREEALGKMIEYVRLFVVPTGGARQAP